MACHSRRGGCRARAPAPAPWRGLKLRHPLSLSRKPIWCLRSPLMSWTLQILSRKRCASLSFCFGEKLRRQERKGKKQMEKRQEDTMLLRMTQEKLMFKRNFPLAPLEKICIGIKTVMFVQPMCRRLSHQNAQPAYWVTPRQVPSWVPSVMSPCWTMLFALTPTMRFTPPCISITRLLPFLRSQLVTYCDARPLTIRMFACYLVLPLCC